jgi:hypothetical protein
MPHSDLLRHWLHTTDDPLSVLSLVLVLFMSATLGAILASLVTWMEKGLISWPREPEHDPFRHAAGQTRTIGTVVPSNPKSEVIVEVRDRGRGVT